MKKVVLAIFLAVSALLSMANAQSNALGLRFGIGDGTNAEVSYQRNLSSDNRLEIDLGLDLGGSESFRVAAIYQWVWDLSGLADGFKWYVGPGAGAFFYKGGMSIGAVGNVGIEYNFNIPLQLSLDFRPGWYFFEGGNDFGWGGVGLGVRYKF